MMDSEPRYCLNCNAEIKGRIDKRFCNDYCRNIYHNNLNKDSTNYIRNVNNILRKNRRILKKLNPVDKAKIREINKSFFLSIN